MTLITRYAEGGNTDSLEHLLLRWQHWCAELLENQLSYPIAAYYHSQHDNQSWLAALTVIIDSCAVILVGLGATSRLQARETFATARLALIEMGRVLGVNALDANRLPPEMFAEMTNVFGEAGLVFTEEDAEARLCAFRGTYEPFLKRLGESSTATPACPDSGARSA